MLYHHCDNQVALCSLILMRTVVNTTNLVRKVKKSLDGLVSFYEDGHKYVVCSTGESLISASQLIKKFSNKFDPDKSILKRCAVREGIPPDELAARWDKKREDSATYGTAVHAELEHFINHRVIRKSDYSDIVEDFSKIKFAGELKSEMLLHSISDGIAGMTDLVCFKDGDTCSIADFKTSEAIKKNAFFGRGRPQQMMLPPLSHYPDSNYWHFALQISTYAYLLDLQGYWIRDLAIFWINPKSRELERITVDYLRGDVKRMLADFRVKSNS